jgi:hypothetical protein
VGPVGLGVFFEQLFVGVYRLPKPSGSQVFRGLSLQRLSCLGLLACLAIFFSFSCPWDGKMPYLETRCQWKD